MSGVIVNSATIIAGGIIGLVFKKILPKKLSEVVMIGVALCVMYIGISGAVEGGQAITGIGSYTVLVAIFSIVLGAVIGGLADFNRLINTLASRVEDKLKDSPSSVSGGFSDSFVSGTLLFCVGAMAVVGSLDAGLTGDNSTLYAKSLLDCISAAVFASTLGWGVICSAVPLFIYQGAIALAAGFLAPLLSTDVIMMMKLVGSLLIIALSLNLLGVTKIKIMNYLPAIFLPIGLVPLCEWLMSVR